MNLDIQHGTRCERDVTDIWGYSPKEILDEIKQLKIGRKLEGIGEDDSQRWMWNSASKNLKNFVIKINEGNDIDWEIIRDRAEQEARKVEEMRLVRSRENEINALKDQVERLEEESRKKKE